MEQSPDIKLKDADLKSKGLEPSTIRRWFKKHYGMTFQSYQRKFKISNAYNNLSSGKSVTHTAFDNGYDSLSGFSDGFQKIFATSPSKMDHQVVLNTVRITTPLGPMIACAANQGICLLEFSDRPGLESYVDSLSKKLNAVLLPGTNAHLEQLQHQIHDYFQGQRKKFDLQLLTSGTDFQEMVWNALHQIPFGETRTYSQQSESHWSSDLGTCSCFCQWTKPYRHNYSLSQGDWERWKHERIRRRNK